MEYSNSSNITEVLYVAKFNWLAIRTVVMIVVSCVGLPLILAAIYSLYKEVKEDNLAPVYLINLLVSDLIQMSSSVCILLIRNTILNISYDLSLLASVGFMMCIAVERYLLVAFPLWYRFRRNIRNSVIVSLLVWVLSVIIAVPPILARDPRAAVSFIVFLLLPFPVLILSLFGTLKALLASIAVSRKDKQKIVTVLVLVLLNYMLLFLPFITWGMRYLKREFTRSRLKIVSRTFLLLNPLVDLLLYVVMRRGTIRKLQLTRSCCSKMAANQPSPAIAENPAVEEEGEEGGACEGWSHADPQPAAPPSPQPSPCSGSV